MMTDMTSTADDISRAIEHLGLSDDDVEEGTSAAPSTVDNRKTRFVAPSDAQYGALLDIQRSLLREGRGEMFLTIGTGIAECSSEPGGLSEEEMSKSIATVRRLGTDCGAEVTQLRMQNTDPSACIADFMVRCNLAEDDFIDIRVAVVGNVDAGKSTMLGVLTHGFLDDGRGKCRSLIFRHKHEQETGRTSSVATDILGFNASGEVVNKSGHDGSLDWLQICSEASKVITFIDLAGHEKYLKTTVFGLTGHHPDFAMLMIGSNMGVVGMTKEHLGLSLALNVPVFIVVTKIDMCPANVLEATMKLLQKILKSPGCRKVPMLVNSVDDVVVSAANFVSERICPIFQVSNVTGENVDLVRLFLNLLRPRAAGDDDAPAEYQIDDTFNVPGVGAVVSGTMLQGIAKANDTLLLGPDAHGHFNPVSIKSVQRRRMPTRELRSGQTGTFALKKIKRKDVRKGMVLVSPALKPVAAMEFEAEVVILHHPSTISARYQAMVHCGGVRQTASIVAMEQEHLRSGDKARIVMRFMQQPEYLKIGARLIFREGRTKAVGTITRLFEAPLDKHVFPAREPETATSSF